MDARHHQLNPERRKLVWESADGPVLVEDMSAEHLRKALAFAERTSFPSEALPAMRERLKNLK